jgi:predicted benzoate:H+ symporter BenE
MTHQRGLLSLLLVAKSGLSLLNLSSGFWVVVEGVRAI